MDKISGILKGSPRVTAVDLKDSAPIRPGTPSFGRPEGVSSLKDKQLMQSSAERSQKEHRELSGWRGREEKHASIAAAMSDRFFAKNRTSTEPSDNVLVVSEEEIAALPALQQSRSSKPAGFKANAIGDPLGTAQTDVVEAFEETEEDMSLYPKGSFIDYSA